MRVYIKERNKKLLTRFGLAASALWSYYFHSNFTPKLYEPDPFSGASVEIFLNFPLLLFGAKYLMSIAKGDLQYMSNLLKNIVNHTKRNVDRIKSKFLVPEELDENEEILPETHTGQKIRRTDRIHLSTADRYNLASEIRRRMKSFDLPEPTEPKEVETIDYEPKYEKLERLKISRIIRALEKDPRIFSDKEIEIDDNYHFGSFRGHDAAREITDYLKKIVVYVGGDETDIVLKGGTVHIGDEGYRDLLKARRINKR